MKKHTRVELAKVLGVWVSTIDKWARYLGIEFVVEYTPHAGPGHKMQKTFSEYDSETIRLFSLFRKKFHDRHPLDEIVSSFNCNFCKIKE